MKGKYIISLCAFFVFSCVFVMGTVFAQINVRKSVEGYTRDGKYFGSDEKPVFYTTCNGGTWVQVSKDPDRYQCKGGVVKGTGPLRGKFKFLD